MATEREVPEGQSRKQIRTIEPVRDYLKAQTAGESTTISQYLLENVLPENYDEIHHGYAEDEIVFAKVTPEVDDRVDAMTGGRVHKGEVLAFYCLIDALRTDDEATVGDLVEYLPEILWTVMEGRA